MNIPFSIKIYRSGQYTTIKQNIYKQKKKKFEIYPIGIPLLKKHIQLGHVEYTNIKQKIPIIPLFKKKRKKKKKKSI